MVDIIWFAIDLGIITATFALGVVLYALFFKG